MVPNSARQTGKEMFLKTTIEYGYLIFAFLFYQACTAAVLEDTEKSAAKPFESAIYQDAIQVGYLANRELNEVSGLACSRLRNDVLWTINDSGSGPFIYAANTQGAHLGKVRVLDAQNQDWEDLASFRLGDVAYLLIADVGDNDEIRSDYFIYVTEEPAITEKMDPAGQSVAWQYRIRFTYEDGSRDCESVAVDLQGQQILLLSKRAVPPILYTLPLFTTNRDNVQVAKRLTAVPAIPQPTLQDIIEDPRFGSYRSQPTAMDVSPDGSTAVVLTYKNGYIFQRTAGEDWVRAFKKIPQLIRLPRLRQAEALCFAADGRTLFVTSEKIPAPLLRLDVISELQSSIMYLDLS
jgi:hypothetical protein